MCEMCDNCLYYERFEGEALGRCYVKGPGYARRERDHWCGWYVPKGKD